MPLIYSQNFLLLNTIRSSICWKSCCPENHFRKNKERSQQRGGTVGTNVLTKKVTPKLYKNVINQKLHHSHVWFVLSVWSTTESIELLKYPLLPSTLMYVYLILPSFFFSFFSQKIRIKVLILDLNRSCGIEV